MKLKLPLLAAALFALVGCGSDDNTANLTLNLTDAPVVGVEQVNIHIDSLTLKKNSDTFEFEIDQTINLLDLQGSASTTLLENQELPAGQYQYIRLDLDQEQSNLVFEGGQQLSFSIPSEAQSGLKLNSPFNLSANGNANFTLDFDVAKSLTLSNSGYKMRPTIRIVDNSTIGHIAGTVAGELINQCESTLAVYAFAGSDADFSEMTETSGPIVSALVNDQNSFEVGYLEAGDYTLHLVCGEDDPMALDNIMSSQSVNVSVVDNKTASADFQLLIN